MPITQSQILSEQHIVHILERARLGHYPNLATVDALCQTVRALQAEIAEFEKTDLVPRSRYNAADAEAREAREMVKTIAGRAKDEIERLQACLSEVQKERSICSRCKGAISA